MGKEISLDDLPEVYAKLRKTVRINKVYEPVIEFLISLDNHSEPYVDLSEIVKANSFYGQVIRFLDIGINSDYKLQSEPIWNLVKEQIPKNEETVYRGILESYNPKNPFVKEHLFGLMEDITEHAEGRKMYLVYVPPISFDYGLVPYGFKSKCYIAITKPLDSADEITPEKSFENASVQFVNKYLLSKI